MKLTVAPLVSCTVCAPGELPPAMELNVSIEGVAVTALVAALVMVKVTPTVAVVAPPVIVTVA